MDAQQRVAVDDLAPLRLLSRAGGGYYGAKKACEPVHVQYSYDDHSVYVVNSEYRLRGPTGSQREPVRLSTESSCSPSRPRSLRNADSPLKALTIPEENFSAASSISVCRTLAEDMQRRSRLAKLLLGAGKAHGVRLEQD